MTTENTLHAEDDLDWLPLTYVYRCQVEEAVKELTAALETWRDENILSDPDANGKIAERINKARQHIRNVYDLVASGVTDWGI